MNIKTTGRGGYQISFVNEQEFELIYKDIFTLKEYDFAAQKVDPFIINCGSHIGLSILYFKKRYPKARILGFEPNPLTFELLEKNIHQNNIENVTLISAAVAKEREEVDFYISKDEQAPWTWGDSAALNKWASGETTKTIRVPSIRLSDYLDRQVDLLKLDVEGLEAVVLKEAEGKINCIKRISMEFHGSSTNPGNDSTRILDLLKANGFSCQIAQDGKSVEEQEIIKEDPHWLIIKAYKEDSLFKIPNWPG